MANYYVLVNTYTEAMTVLYSLREAGFVARVAPAPHDYHNQVGCGVSALIDNIQAKDAENYLNINKISYVRVVKHADGCNLNRDIYC